MTDRPGPADSFVPTPDRAEDFRRALGRFATGVTVITCAGPDGPLGITANSFASLSLDPPLVMWAPGRFSRRFDAFAGAPHFAVHVMGAEHFRLCRGFARDGAAFAGLDWRSNPEGVPVFDACLSRFECEKVAEHPGGDHAVIVGRVRRAMTRAGAPLVFFGGRYGGFAGA